MKIYIDDEYKCHVSDDGTMTEVETDFFDDKCDTLVEGYRFVPQGANWTRSDDVVFQGEMAAPWKDFAELDEAQRVYERHMMEEYREALEMIFAGVTE